MTEEEKPTEANNLYLVNFREGKIGLGTMAPALSTAPLPPKPSLTWQGDTASDPLTIRHISGTVGLTLTADGKVGVGGITPTTALEVSGTVKATAFQGNGAALTNVKVTGRLDVGGALSAPLPVAGRIQRPDPRPSTTGALTWFGGQSMTLETKGTVLVSTDVTYRPTSKNINWIGLRVRAFRTLSPYAAEVVEAIDNTYCGGRTDGYTTGSFSALLYFPAAGKWTIQIGVHKAGGDSVAVEIHTFTLSCHYVSSVEPDGGRGGIYTIETRQP